MEGEPEYFLKGTKLLVHRCEKCAVIKGDCIEKQQTWFISVLKNGKVGLFLY
jgi:hypothetical protein